LKANGMDRSLTIAIAFTLALTCAAAAKSTLPVHVPLPRDNPLRNTEQEPQQNSEPAMALFSEKKLPSLGKAMAIGYYPRGCRAQPAVPGGDGCDKSLDHWFADWILRLKIPEFGSSSRGLKLKDLPRSCTAVLNAPASPASAATKERSESR
jgi:murein endopeptidase